MKRAREPPVNVEVYCCREDGLKMSELKKYQNFLKYAIEAAEKTREAHQIMGGGEPIPEDSSLLGEIYYSIWEMIKEYLVAINIKVPNDDEEFNNMIAYLMFCKKEEEIEKLLKEYCVI